MTTSFLKRVTPEVEKRIKEDAKEYVGEFDNSSVSLGSTYPHSNDHCELVFYNKNSVAVFYVEIAGDLSVTHADFVEDQETEEWIDR